MKDNKGFLRGEHWEHKRTHWIKGYFKNVIQGLGRRTAPSLTFKNVPLKDWVKETWNECLKNNPTKDESPCLRMLMIIIINP